MKTRLSRPLVSLALPLLAVILGLTTVAAAQVIEHNLVASDRATMGSVRLLLALLVMTALSGTTNAQSIELANPFPNLTFSSPVDMQSPDDGSELLYVVEKAGRVKVFENNAATTIDTFIDITNRVSTSGEQGLLGMAFDPDYAANSFFYLNYSVSDPRRQRVSRFLATTPTAADPDSEVILFEGDPALPGNTNHNAGAITFGPPEGPGGERYLFVTMGDGGSGNDPENNGQNRATLLGSIVRLDVNGGGLPLDCADAGVATVPADNPCLDGPGGDCDEIYAYGMRNPWRMTFDEAAGQFWIGDVGQSAWEEVDVLERGGNFGWRVYEGNHCTNNDPCDPSGKISPVLEYGHTSGHCSITGGYVYRGAAIPELQGWYVYADWCSGFIWAFDPNDPRGTNKLIENFATFSLTTFGTDEADELYALAEDGQIRKFVPNVIVADEEAPSTLSPSLDIHGPNPVSGQTSLRFLAPSEGHVLVAVYDVLGREVARLFDREVRPVSLRYVTFDASNLPTGMYVARLITGGATLTQKLTVVR